MKSILKDSIEKIESPVMLIALLREAAAKIDDTDLDDIDRASSRSIHALILEVLEERYSAVDEATMKWADNENDHRSYVEVVVDTMTAENII